MKIIKITDHDYEIILAQTSPSKLYHVAPSTIRESIMKNGLDYHIHFGNQPRPTNTRDVSYAPRANYLEEQLKNSVKYAQEAYPKGYDVWEVDVTGLKLFRDNAWYLGWYCKSRIEPSRLKLVKTNNPHKTAAKIKAEYVGNCRDSFDLDTGDSLINCFYDVSDFAVQEENGKEITKEIFDSIVTMLSDVKQDTKNHQLKYFVYEDRNVYVLYDQDTDIHYFFQ